MPTPVISEGIAIKYPGTGPAHDGGRWHTCVVVRDDDVRGDVYLVPICSVHYNCDTTCLLNCDTPSLNLNRASFVAYHAGKKVPRTALQKKLTATEITYLGIVDSAVFKRIKEGVNTSNETEAWFKKGVLESPKPKILPAK